MKEDIPEADIKEAYGRHYFQSSQVVDVATNLSAASERGVIEHSENKGELFEWKNIQQIRHRCTM